MNLDFVVEYRRFYSQIYQNMTLSICFDDDDGDDDSDDDGGDDDTDVDGGGSVGINWWRDQCVLWYFQNSLVYFTSVVVLFFFQKMAECGNEVVNMMYEQHLPKYYRRPGKNDSE